MYSPLYFKISAIVNRYVLILGVSGISGFSWKHASKKHSRNTIEDYSKVKVTAKNLRKVYKTVALHSITSIFIVCRTIQSYLEDNKDFTICYIFALIISFLTISLINIVFNIHSLKTLLCRSQQFALSFREKWVESYNYKSTPTGLLLDVCLILQVIWFIIVLPSSFVIFLLTFRHLPILPHTILPLNIQHSWPLQALFTSFYTYLSLAITANALQQSFMLTVYFATAVPLLRKEFKGGLDPVKYTTKPSLRHPFNLVKEYLALELLHQHGMLVYGIMTVIGESMISQFILYCNYTLIRHWDDLELVMKSLIIIMSFDMTVFWCATLEVCGRFHMNSTKLLKSWKFLESRSKAEAKFMRKFKKRCRPLTVGLEGVRKIKRLSVLKFIKTLVSATVRTLLTLQ